MNKLLFILCILLCLNTNAQIITTVAGNGGGGAYTGDGGQATAALFNYPDAVTVDALGNLYVVDQGNSVIRKVNTSGIITTIAGNGNGITTCSGDGGNATDAKLNSPTSVIFDTSGNLYISDDDNGFIRKVNTSGIINTIVGDYSWGCGPYGFSGDGGQASLARLDYPYGITFDAAGNLYIADEGNNRIRKVNTSGIITTVAGNGNGLYAGDGGQATDASLNAPYRVDFDAIGNMYIADGYNHCIRKVDNAGIISTIAGDGTAGYIGDGGQATAAELYYPQDIAIDAIGNIFIADGTVGYSRVRKINTAGIISTVAGIGPSGFSGDGGQATAARLDGAIGISLDNSGNLYIADWNNNRIRKVTNVATMSISQYSNLTSQISIYPNPSSGIFTIETNTTTKQTMQVYDVNGKTVLTQTINGKATIDMSNLSTGVYNINLSSNEGVVNKRVVIVR